MTQPPLLHDNWAKCSLLNLSLRNMTCTFPNINHLSQDPAAVVPPVQHHVFFLFNSMPLLVLFQKRKKNCPSSTYILPYLYTLLTPPPLLSVYSSTITPLLLYPSSHPAPSQPSPLILTIPDHTTPPTISPQRWKTTVAAGGFQYAALEQ